MEHRPSSGRTALACTLTALLVLNASAQEEQAQGAEEEPARLRMHRPAFSFEAPESDRPEQADRERTSLFGGDGAGSLSPQADIPHMPAPAPRQPTKRSPSRRNWILPPTPSDLEEEQEDGTRGVGDLFSPADPAERGGSDIFDRVYEAGARASGLRERAGSAEAQQEQGYTGFLGPDQPAQLVPESGIDFTAVPASLSFYGVSPGQQEDASSLDVGGGGLPAAGLFSAGAERGDETAGEAALALRSLADAAEAAPGASMSFGGTRRYLDAQNADAFVPMTAMSSGFGAGDASVSTDGSDWRNVFTRTARTLSDFNQADAAQPAAPSRGLRFGAESEPATRPIADPFARFTDGDDREALSSFRGLDGSGSGLTGGLGFEPGGEQGLSRLGGIEPVGGVSAAGGSSIGGTGFGSLPSAQPERRGSGIRATDQMPDPLGKSIFD